MVTEEQEKTDDKILVNKRENLVHIYTSRIYDGSDTACSVDHKCCIYLWVDVTQTSNLAFRGSCWFAKSKII